MRETWSTTARRLNTPTRRLWEEGFDRFYGILQFVVRKSVANPRSWLNQGGVQRHGKIAQSAEIRRSYTDADPPCKRCWGSFSVRFAHRKLRGRHNGIAKPHMLQKSTGFSLGGGLTTNPSVVSKNFKMQVTHRGGVGPACAQRTDTPSGPPRPRGQTSSRVRAYICRITVSVGIKFCFVFLPAGMHSWAKRPEVDHIVGRGMSDFAEPQFREIKARGNATSFGAQMARGHFLGPFE